MQAGNFLHFVLAFLGLPPTKVVHSQRFTRIATILRRLLTATLLMLSSILVGTLGYVFIEHYPWFDAYYMAVITLASVGFGEVHPLSTAGKIFTTFLILFNVGLFAYAISTITGIFAEGGFHRLLNDFRMNKRVENIHEHTIVCGFGRHAIEVTQELTKQCIPFVVVESNPAKIDFLRSETNYLFVEGDATEDETLAEAGIKRASAIVITLPDDADNMFITLSARQINPGLRIISRANGIADEIKIRRAGADHTVVPEPIGGFYMANLVNQPDLVEFFSLLSNMGPSNVMFEEVGVPQLQDSYQNETIGNSGLDRVAPVSIVAVRHSDGQYQFNPPSSLYLSPDLRLVLLGNPDQVAQFRKKAFRAA
ncbi:MAG: potassium channel family protein [Saprospiraceae bacterium]|nr:potassium channel family protein [Saprospiraceae bacterium]